MFRHGEMLLLPHARRIICHRNRTRRGNSSFPFQFVFRIRHCIFSARAHISSWSRTRDTTSIRGLNHGWNRTIVMNISAMSACALPFQTDADFSPQQSLRRKEDWTHISCIWFCSWCTGMTQPMATNFPAFWQHRWFPWRMCFCEHYWTQDKLYTDST